MKLYKYLSIGLAAALVVVLLFSYFHKKHIVGINNELRGRMERESELTQLNDSLHTRLCEEVDRFKYEKEDWLGLLEEKDQIIHTMEEASIYIKPFKKKKKSSKVDTVYKSDPTTKLKELRAFYKVSFKAENGVVKVKGYTLYPTGEYEVDIKGKPVKLEVAVVETKNGLRKGYIRTSTPDLIIKDWKLKYKRMPRPSGGKRFSLLLGSTFIPTDRVSFIAGGALRISSLPPIGVYAHTDKGIGVYVTYP